jgi:NAD(P)-dependent dehydrogenase (short-subunit alcohol dehydrogenase family)
MSPIVAGPRQTEASAWRQILEVNLTGGFLGARAAPRVTSEGGRLIFTGSVLGERPRKGLTAYNAPTPGWSGWPKAWRWISTPPAPR